MVAVHHHLGGGRHGAGDDEGRDGEGEQFQGMSFLSAPDEPAPRLAGVAIRAKRSRTPIG